MGMETLGADRVRRRTERPTPSFQPGTPKQCSGSFGSVPDGSVRKPGDALVLKLQCSGTSRGPCSARKGAGSIHRQCS